MRNCSYGENDINISKLYERDVRENTSVLTASQEKELFQRYHEGDLEAKRIIIESNLSLVIFYVEQMESYCRHLKFLDLVQEGNIGLIEAVERFDYKFGTKFSTYATDFIKGAIKGAIANKNREIDLPENLYWATSRYKNLVLEYQKCHGVMPSDKEICEKMNVSYSTMKKIRNQSGVSIDSLNRTVDESEESELEEIIAGDNKSAQQFLNNMADYEWKVLLKEILTPAQYFVVFSRYFCETALSLRQLEDYLGLSRTSINTLEKNAFYTVKQHLRNNQKELKQKSYELRQRFGKDFYRINASSVNPLSILNFIFLKPILTPQEEQLLYLQQFGTLKYSEQELAKTLNMSLKQYRVFSINLEQKISVFFQQNQFFPDFVTYMVKTYKTSLFNIDLQHLSKDYILEFKTSFSIQKKDYVREIEKKIV